MARPTLKKFGPLEALVVGGEASASTPTIVLFHGYGADAYDLSSLSEEIDLPTAARWVFPQGPLQVQIGPGFFGRAWFPIDLEAHQRALDSDRGVDYSESRTPAMDRARDQALQMLAQLKVDPARLILGGFSQGSMLAVDVALQLPVPPAGVAVLSGTLVDEANLKALAPRHRGLRFFQSHGQYDEVLPFSGAEGLERALTACGWDGFLLSFKGGHEIPQIVLHELQSYFQDALKLK